MRRAAEAPARAAITQRVGVTAEGNSDIVILLLIPLTLAALAGLLFFTEALERRSSNAMVRMSLRSPKSTPEATESLVAAELAGRLEAAGLGRRPIAEVAEVAHVAPEVAKAVLANEDTGEFDPVPHPDEADAPT